MSKGATPKMEPAGRSRAGLSLVWLVPVLALLISLFVAWQTYSGRGPVIEVSFAQAEGILAGETKLKYRDVEVGLVEEVRFTENLDRVITDIRLDPKIAGFVDEDAEFWVVKPRVTTRGVSGLQTVLGGVYIEGSWDTNKDTAKRIFTGRADPPISQFGVDGLRLTLRSKDGNQIASGTPILYKGVEVGRVENPRLSTGGDAVLFDAFIEAPHNKLVTTATRFWDASGFSFSFGAGGAKIDVESLASLVGGGISFDTLVSGGRKPTPGRIFDLFESEDAVRNNLFSRPTGSTVSYAIAFDGTVSGLTAGAPVEFRGIKIGEVSSLSAAFVDEGEDISAIRLLVVVEIDPGALGLNPSAGQAETTEFLRFAVASGLRARLVTASLLTGGLKVELAELVDPVPASIITTAGENPLLPSVAAEISDVSASAEGMFKRINDLPVEELINSAVTLLNSINGLANDPDIQRTPAEIFGLLSDAREVVSSEEIAGIPQDVSVILTSLQTTAKDLEKVIGRLSDDATVAALVGAIEAAHVTIKNVQSASVGLPAIAREIEVLAARAGELPLDALVASTTKLVGTVDALAGSEAMEDIPPALTAALEQIRGLTQTIREGDLVENASATFAATQKAATNVETASESLPELLTRLNRAAAQAQTTLSGFDEDSRFSEDARQTLRDIQQAADAVSSLARAIERRPNSLITGR